MVGCADFSFGYAILEFGCVVLARGRAAILLAGCDFFRVVVRI